MQKRDILSSPRLSELKKERQKNFIYKILLFLFALMVIFGTLAYLSHLPSLKIKEVSIVGNKVIDTEMIKNVVDEKIAGNYLGLFPKANILYYSKSGIKNVLGEKFKRLKDISFSIEGDKVLEVSVAERVPLYTWCVAAPVEFNTDKDKCYFVDENGFIFDEAPYFSGNVYFKFYGQAEFGSYFYKDSFSRLISFKKTLENMNLKPVILNEKDGGDVEVFLSSSAFSPDEHKILLKSDADFEKVAENLQAALTTEPLQSELKNKYSSLLYIDLRYGNKVYFKFK